MFYCNYKIFRVLLGTCVNKKSESHRKIVLAAGLAGKNKNNNIGMISVCFMNS